MSSSRPSESRQSEYGVLSAGALPPRTTARLWECDGLPSLCLGTAETPKRPGTPASLCTQPRTAPISGGLRPKRHQGAALHNAAASFVSSSGAARCDATPRSKYPLGRKESMRGTRSFCWRTTRVECSEDRRWISPSETDRRPPKPGTANGVAVPVFARRFGADHFEPLSPSRRAPSSSSSVLRRSSRSLSFASFSSSF